MNEPCLGIIGELGATNDVAIPKNSGIVIHLWIVIDIDSDEWDIDKITRYRVTCFVICISSVYIWGIFGIVLRSQVHARCCASVRSNNLTLA